MNFLTVLLVTYENFVLLLFICLVLFKKIRITSRAVFLFVMSLLVPVVSAVYVLIYIRYKNQKTDEEERNEVPSADHPVVISPSDLENDHGIVPISDILNLNNYDLRRKMVMTTLNSDTLHYVRILKRALENADSETAHYAASIIMEVQKNMIQELSLAEANYRRNPKDTLSVSHYEKQLFRLIFSDLFDKTNLQRYTAQYKQLSDAIINSPSPAEKYLQSRLKVDFATDDLENARMTCERYRTLYPDSEKMYASYIQYYCMAMDRDGLDQLIEEIGSAPVYLTQTTLKYIRFFAKV